MLTFVSDYKNVSSIHFILEYLNIFTIILYAALFWTILFIKNSTNKTAAKYNTNDYYLYALLCTQDF